jgi:3-phenylpropionate/trans-cinnamate dioxygenase ferredoxin reductase subunit
MPGPFVVVGANLTGGAAVTTLREEGYDGRVVLIGEEPHPPYERPPLSKEYLRGEDQAARLFLHPMSWYEENGVELMLGTRAVRIDPDRRVVELSSGGGVDYEAVLVATGGRNRALPVPGRDLENVLSLRTIEDADRIRRVAVAGQTAVVVGAGFIGSEVTASLRTMGVEVDVVEVLEAPLLRVLGPELAAVYEAIHRDHGVRFHLGQGVARFEGTSGVEAVVTDAGERVECDFVVVGVGIEPATEVVTATDVTLDDGIVVDPVSRTNVPGIFAAGDVANHVHPLFARRLRVEHWDNALKQGAAAARSMMGRGEAFTDPHWFWSDQYEHNLQVAGVAQSWDRMVLRGSLESRSFVAFSVDEAGILRAAAGLDRGKDVRRAMKLISAKARPDPERLADEDVDLRTLTPR